MTTVEIPVLEIFEISSVAVTIPTTIFGVPEREVAVVAVPVTFPTTFPVTFPTKPPVAVTTPRLHQS